MEECLGVDAPADRLFELNTRCGLELGEVSQDRTLRARCVAIGVVVVQIFVHRVPALVALSSVVIIIAVCRYVVSDLLTDGDRRLRASNKLNSKSGEHELMINGII